jgi:hypothetical protein
MLSSIINWITTTTDEGAVGGGANNCGCKGGGGGANNCGCKGGGEGDL